MRRIVKGLLVVMLALGLVGCAGFLENTYKAEYVTGSAYHVWMQSIANLQQAGTVTAEQRVKVNAKADLVYKSYIVSVDALVTYYNVKDDNTQAMVNKCITSLFTNWADLAALINSISPNTVPTSVMTLKGGAGSEETTVTIKRLDAGTISIIIQVGSAIVQFVLPEIQKVVNVISQKVVTLEEIQALKTLIKPPTEY